MRADWLALSAFDTSIALAAFTAIAVTASTWRALLVSLIPLMALYRVFGWGVCVHAGYWLGGCINEILALYTGFIARLGAAVVTATALTTLAVWGVLRSVCCRAAHGCSHGGLVGQRYILLCGIQRWALLGVAFTARTLGAAAFTRLA